MAHTGKNNWALFLLLLAGIVLGGFIGYLTQGTPGLSWLNYGQTFGVLVLTFGLTIKFNIASILGIVIAAIIYRKM